MDLTANYAGLKLKNPVIVASATPTISLDTLKRSVDSGAGALVTKSVVFSKPWIEGWPHKPGERCGCNHRPRFTLVNKDIEFDRGLHARGALYSLACLAEPYPTPEEWAPVMEKIKAYTDIPIIVSICAAEKDYDEWQRLAKLVQDMGADAIETSMHHMPYNNYTDPEIVRAVKDVVKVPVVPKPMVPWEDPVAIGKALVEKGADGITAIGNQPLRAVEVDIDREDFFFAPTILAWRGPWFRPVGLNWILQLARTVNVPLSGVTGVASYKDVVKYILCGADTVQVCTAIYVEGYEVIAKMVDGLAEWMKDHGYQSINDFKGKLVKKWRPITEIESNPPVKAAVNEDCTGCGFCVKTCFFSAIRLGDNRAIIDQNACDGCGLCVAVCPFDAVIMKRVEA